MFTKDDKKHGFNQYEYVNQYVKESYNTFVVRIRKDSDLLDRVTKKCDELHISRNELINRAIRMYLDSID